jgi:hypothetical protein
MFFNISNHPSYSWGPEQKKQASKFGTIIDIQFPNVNPNASIEEIDELAQSVCTQVESLAQWCRANTQQCIESCNTLIKRLKHSLQHHHGGKTTNSRL